MKLYDQYPDHITFNGRKYRLYLDFRNVLRMIDILQDDSLMPDAREYLAVKCVCRHPRKGMLFYIEKMLFPKKGDPDHKRITDYSQDADLIRAAFQQEYGIDLDTEKMHWMRFSCLLSGLPSGNRYSEVLSIRARPVPSPTQFNKEEREWLIRAKAECALDISESERERQYQRDVANVASLLLGMVEKG